MDHRTKHKTQNHKTPRKQHRRNTTEESTSSERCWNIHRLKNLTSHSSQKLTQNGPQNIKHKTIKLPENNTGEKPTWFELAMTTYLCGSICVYGGPFLVFFHSPMTTYNTKSTICERNNKLDFIKIISAQWKT